MLSRGMADRRGLRPRLLFKTTPSGKGANTKKRNWMLCSGWMGDRRGLRPRLLFKTTPSGKGAGPGKRTWMLRSGGMRHKSEPGKPARKPSGSGFRLIP
jgi:hypothetical protein